MMPAYPVDVFGEESALLSWDAVAEREVDLMVAGLQMLETYKMAYLATVRKDGGPRLHPVSPQIIRGHLFIGIRRSSPKLYDLLRDSRYMLHALPGQEDAEFSVRGRAIRIDDAETRALAGPADGSGVLWGDEDVLFELLLGQVCLTSYKVDLESAHPILTPIRRTWPALISIDR